MIHVMAVVMLSSMLEERCPRKRLGNSRGAMAPSTVRPGQLACHPPATLADASRAGAVHVCKNIPTAPTREICARQVPDALALPPVESCREASPPRPRPLPGPRPSSKRARFGLSNESSVFTTGVSTITPMSKSRQRHCTRMRLFETSVSDCSGGAFTV